MLTFWRSYLCRDNITVTALLMLYIIAHYRMALPTLTSEYRGPCPRFKYKSGLLFLLYRSGTCCDFYVTFLCDIHNTWGQLTHMDCGFKLI